MSGNVEVKLMSLSHTPSHPCILLKSPRVTIMLDCAVDFSALSSFLPWAECERERFQNMSHFPKDLPRKCLKQWYGNVFIDAPFEFQFALFDINIMKSVDAILVSNYKSLVALPYYSECGYFHGDVYVTDPVAHLGRLVVEELLDAFDRVDRETDPFWKQPAVYSKFPNAPKTDPQHWMPFYTRKQLEMCLFKAKIVSYKHPINILEEVTVTAYSSGYSIGSSNWVIKVGREKIGYLSSTSARISHTRPVQWDALRKLEYLVLTSLSRYPERGPEASVSDVFKTMADTLKDDGCVLLPLCPTGIIYDLLELIDSQLDQHDVPAEIPVYYISPIAKKTLAFSNIFGQWLMLKRQNRIFIPDDPFKHGAMKRTGRLKEFNELHEDFAQNISLPCVIIAGHPSLRFGHIVHFLELWGNDPKNAIILTDPDYPLEEVYGPYKYLPIRSFFYPIDTLLSYSQLNSSVIPDLAPKLLIVPKEYSQPSSSEPQRVDCTITHVPKALLSYRSTVALKVTMATRRVLVHHEVLSAMKIMYVRRCPKFRVSYMAGLLSSFNRALELKPFQPGKPVKTFCVGILKCADLCKVLDERSLKYTLMTNSLTSEECIHLTDFDAVITISEGGTRSNIHCALPSVRRMIADAIQATLIQHTWSIDY